MSHSAKANFDEIYAHYSPKEYMHQLVKTLNYTLPFQSMLLLKQQCQQLLAHVSPLRVTIVGSSHGLDAVTLKYGFSQEQMIDRWGNENNVLSLFPASNSGIQTTLLDIQPEPLRFAMDTQLADQTFVVDLNQPYSSELKEHLQHNTDVISVIGATSYIKIESLAHMIKTAFSKGQTKIFYFSVVNYLEGEHYIKMCHQYGLQAKKLVTLPQRDYKNDEEKRNIHQLLKKRGVFCEADEGKLMASLYLAQPV